MKLSFYFVFVQAIGVIGMIASVLAFQCREHKKLMVFRTVNELLFGVQYGLLGAYTGMAMNLIGCVRNLLFARMVEKKKSTLPLQIGFSAVFLVFVLLTWSGYKSILSGAAKVLSTIAYGSARTFLVRGMILITSASWLVYNFLVKSYAGCVCELLTLCSIIIGMIRLDLPCLLKREKRQNASR